MTRYRVGALVTGMIYEDIEANSEEEAKEIMLKKHGDESIELCHYCAKGDGACQGHSKRDKSIFLKGNINKIKIKIFLHKLVAQSAICR